MSKQGHISVHKLEKSRFLARIHMEYFQMGIFVIPWVYLIRKYGSQTQVFFWFFKKFLTIFEHSLNLRSHPLPKEMHTKYSKS